MKLRLSLSVLILLLVLSKPDGIFADQLDVLRNKPYSVVEIKEMVTEYIAIRTGQANEKYTEEAFFQAAMKGMVFKGYVSGLLSSRRTPEIEECLRWQSLDDLVYRTAAILQDVKLSELSVFPAASALEAITYACEETSYKAK